MQTKIAAIFDVDGTLITGNSLERIFIGFLIREGELRSNELVRVLGGALEGLPLRANKSYLRGKDYHRMSLLARRCFDEEIAPRLLRSAVARVRWHQAAGHEVALLSGTLDLLLAPLADFLGIRVVCGTQLEIVGGQFTGRIIGSHPFGEGKVERMREMTRRYGFDLSKSFAYADHYADRHLLDKIGHPVAANPDRQLRALAGTRNWVVEDFSTGKLGWYGEPAFGLGLAGEGRL
jgi:HAD superfamily hydrolase (TIGR01490 family)